MSCIEDLKISSETNQHTKQLSFFTSIESKKPETLEKSENSEKLDNLNNIPTKTIVDTSVITDTIAITLTDITNDKSCTMYTIYIRFLTMFKILNNVINKILKKFVSQCPTLKDYDFD